MQDTDLAIAELEYCMKDLGLAGVQIGTNINQLNLDEPRFFPIFERAAELGAAIFIHPWEMMGEAQTKKYWLPWLVGMPAETTRAICSLIFGGVLEKLPTLRIAFAHGGGSFPYTLGRISHGAEMRPDLCKIDNPHPVEKYLGKFWVDSLTHNPDMLKYIVELFGAKKVCLGTDYPFPLGESPAGDLVRSVYAEDLETQAQIFETAALEWLGMRREQFI
jgi:aminocarboxymuconate-semialdehyde decarboxylase